MLPLLRRCEKTTVFELSKSLTSLLSQRKFSSTQEDGEFFPLTLYKIAKKQMERKRIHKDFPERADSMPVDQDWPSVWPVARTFHPATVPLPLRQGLRVHEYALPPKKHGNAELMKIPNFLHLTPPAIKRHCYALRRFCTKWPAELNTEEKCMYHFPVEIITSDYVYASPTIREPLARIVNLKIQLKALHLDAHARDKLLRLVGNRYDPDSNVITITADRCPTRKQNLDYVNYLFTALYHESWHKADWENEKTEVDMEYYDWEKSNSRKNVGKIYAWPAEPTEETYQVIPHVSEYKTAISDIMNTGEDQFTIDKYKEAVKNVLNLQ